MPIQFGAITPVAFLQDFSTEHKQKILEKNRALLPARCRNNNGTVGQLVSIPACIIDPKAGEKSTTDTIDFILTNRDLKALNPFLDELKNTDDPIRYFSNIFHDFIKPRLKDDWKNHLVSINANVLLKLSPPAWKIFREAGSLPVNPDLSLAYAGPATNGQDGYTQPEVTKLDPWDNFTQVLQKGRQN